jgi:transcriptional regulator with XRE-family HTH domain
VSAPLRSVVGVDRLVGRNVQRIRKEADLVQRQLAKRMSDAGFDWKRITVAEVESGKRKLSLPEMLGMADLFGLSLNEFLSTEAHEWVALNATRVVPGYAVCGWDAVG